MEGTSISRFSFNSNPSDENTQLNNSQVKIRIALGCLFLYFVVGWFAYCFIFESFTFTNATYFLMVTLTTVGYGDLTPTSQSSRLFTLIFVLFGIAIVAVALVEIAEFVMKKREAIMKKAQSEMIRNAGSDEDEAEESESPKASTTLDKAKAFIEAHPIISVIFNFTAYAVVAGGVFAGVEGWPFMDGVYFSIITGTTIGYGDISPHTVGGRWLAVVFLPIAVIFVSTQLGQLANILMGNTEDSKLKALLNVDLSLEALLNMDADGDGEISEFEFIKFMLSSAGMADEDILDSLHKRFMEMDEDGSGALTKEDVLLLVARQQRQREEMEEEEKGHPFSNARQ